MPKIAKFCISLIIPFAAGFIGNLATISSVSTWYAALEKPVFNPPNWIFAPVWTFLYVLIGISLYVVWSQPYKKSKRVAYSWFAAQMALNTLWSLVFFGLRVPWLGVVVILLLLLSIAMTFRSFLPISRLAAYLLAPYFAWVTFATLLTIAIAILNV